MAIVDANGGLLETNAKQNSLVLMSAMMNADSVAQRELIISTIEVMQCVM